MRVTLYTFVIGPTGCSTTTLSMACSLERSADQAAALVTIATLGLAIARVEARPVLRRAYGRHMGFAPKVPHFVNLPLAFLQRIGLAGAAVAHLMNLPLASRQGAASAGVDSRAIDATANIILRTTCSSRRCVGRGKLCWK